MALHGKQHLSSLEVAPLLPPAHFSDNKVAVGYSKITKFVLGVILISVLGGTSYIVGQYAFPHAGTWKWYAAAGGSVVILLLTGVAYCCYRKRKGSNRIEGEESHAARVADEASSLEAFYVDPPLSYADLRAKKLNFRAVKVKKGTLFLVRGFLEPHQDRVFEIMVPQGAKPLGWNSPKYGWDFMGNGGGYERFMGFYSKPEFDQEENGMAYPLREVKGGLQLWEKGESEFTCERIN